MKPKIHPEFNKVQVNCACGSSFESMSTSKELKVDVCSSCHPFFTGTQRFVDTAGRVERFQAKIDAQKQMAALAAAKAEKKPRRAAAKPSSTPAAAAVAPAPASATAAASPTEPQAKVQAKAEPPTEK